MTQGRYRCSRSSRSHSLPGSSVPAALRQDGPVPCRTCCERRRIDVLKFPCPLHHEPDKARFHRHLATGSDDAGTPSGLVQIFGAYRAAGLRRPHVGCQITRVTHGRSHPPGDKHFERGKPMTVVIICVARTRCCSCSPRARCLEIGIGHRRRIARQPFDVVRGRSRASRSRPIARSPSRGETRARQVRPEGPFGDDGLLLGPTRSRAPMSTLPRPSCIRNDPILCCARSSIAVNGPAVEGIAERGARSGACARRPAVPECSACGPRGWPGDALHR